MFRRKFLNEKNLLFLINGLFGETMRVKAYQILKQFQVAGENINFFDESRADSQYSCASSGDLSTTSVVNLKLKLLSTIHR